MCRELRYQSIIFILVNIFFKVVILALVFVYEWNIIDVEMYLNILTSVPAIYGIVCVCLLYHQKLKYLFIK